MKPGISEAAPPALAGVSVSRQSVDADDRNLDLEMHGCGCG